MARVRSKDAAKRVDGCDLCGEAHRLSDGSPGCTGHRSTARTEDGKRIRCKARPVNGTPVCKTHGGVQKQTKALGLARIQFAQQEGEIAALLRACDLPEQHPLDGLLEVVRHSGAMARLLGHLVGGLKQEPTFDTFVTEDGVEKVASNDALYGLNHVGDEAPSVLVALYEKWLTLYGRACKMALDANIDERLVRNAEQTGDIMVTAFADAIASGNLTIAQREAMVTAFEFSLQKHTGPLELR